MLTSVKLGILKNLVYFCETNCHKMNRRLEQFLKAENISQSQFADSIGVARASVSHILSGRNRPGFDFLLNMSKAYPALNLEWLITGKGRMYGGGKPSTSIFEDEEASAERGSSHSAETRPALTYAVRTDKAQSDIYAIQAKADTSANDIKPIDNKRNISKIVVFFDDNTFQEYLKD